MSRGRKKRGRPIDGLLLLDKPAGVSSNASLQEVKRLFFAAKAGHTGSLDPMATGVLPICLGEATKFSQYLLNASKAYRALFVLGISTDTQDADGQVVSQQSIGQLTEADITQAIQDFEGKQQQIPPMYSALKVDGQRLYDLARQGVEVEREARDIEVSELELHSIRCCQLRDLQKAKSPQCDSSQESEAHPEPIAPLTKVFEIDLSLSVSKGTYIRSLVADLGESLGVGGYLGGLIRTRVGDFVLSDAVSIEQLRGMKVAEQLADMDALLIPPMACLAHMPNVVLDESTAFYLLKGNPVMVPKVPLDGEVSISDESGRLLGVGFIDDEGRVAPKRLISSG